MRGYEDIIMIKKKYNWINDEVKIDFPLPKILQYQIEELEELDGKKDYLYFDRCDDLDIDAKNLYVEGVITKEQWNKLITRYDWSVE